MRQRHGRKERGTTTEDLATTTTILYKESLFSSGVSPFFLRLPLFLLALSVILWELCVYASIRLVVSTWEFLRHRPLFAALSSARTYSEWSAVARVLDDATPRTAAWRSAAGSRLYDSELVAKLSAQLRGCRGDTEKIPQLLHCMQSACVSDVGGVENEDLYSRTYLGTKHAVQQLVDELVHSLSWLREVMSSASAPGSREQLPEGVPRMVALFCDVARRNWGRAALCLSGGAAMAYPHLGVVKELLAQGVLPDVISGTSCGALIAALACVRTDEEVADVLSRPEELSARLVFNDDSRVTMMRRFLVSGHLCDTKKWEERVKWVTLGDTTFLEAYQRTGRALNISVTTASSTSPHLLNYITAPNVCIFSAVLASAAMPVALRPYDLVCKNEETGELELFTDISTTRWRDGSLSTDIPKAHLARMFGVKYTIVSQCNPHVVFFFFNARGAAGAPVLHRQGLGWRGGFVLSWFERFLKLDMIKWLALIKELDLMPRVFGQDWGKLFLQEFGGTVTLVPRPMISRFLSAVRDPDTPHFAWNILEGQRATWPKLSMIRNRMTVEKALDSLCALPCCCAATPPASAFRHTPSPLPPL